MASVNPEPRGFLSPRLARQAWKLVAIAALVFSAWSLFTVARHWGVPVPIAVITSMVFDGGMLLASDYSIRHVHARTRGRGLARTAMLLFAVASVALNAEHAVLDHDAAAAVLLFAAPAIIGLLLLEVHARFRMSFHRPEVPVQQELPLIRGWSWVLHPVESWAEFTEAVRPGATLPVLGSGVQEHEPVPVVSVNGHGSGRAAAPSSGGWS